MLALYSVILGFSAFAFTAVGTWALIKLLPELELIDAPNERSNHALPTPRGGGLAVTSAALFFMIAAAANHWVVYAVAIAALVSFIDDRRHVSPVTRLAVHLLTALMAVHVIEFPVFPHLMPVWKSVAVHLDDGALHHVRQALPLMLDHLFSALLLVYFMNIYNFMDGIDEITVAETCGIGLGLVAVAWAAVGQGLPGSLAMDGMILTGVAGGFWLFNRHPARIFLGDVGSVPLGLMTGFLLLLLASQGCWQAALILPAYYLVDASSTLLARVLRGEKFWQAHSKHAYQRAVRAGIAHDRVSHAVLGLNVILVALAALSTIPHPHAGMLALAAAYGLSAAFVVGLRFLGRRSPAAIHG